MAVSDAVGLLFKIRADSDEAQRDIKKLRNTFDSEVKAIEKGGTDSFLKLGQSVGLTTGQMAGLTKALPFVATGMAAIGAAAVAVGVALFALAKHSSEVGSALFDASQKVSLTVETLSAIKVAAEKSDSSLQEFTQGFVRFERALTDAASGNKKLSKTFTDLGIDAEQGLRKPEEAFKAFLKSFNSLEKDAARTTVATDLFGKSGANLKGTFETVGSSLDEYTEKMRALGLVMSEEAAANADEFGDTLTDLGLVADAVGRKFADTFAPEITNAMKDIQESLIDSEGQWTSWGNTINRLINGLRITVKAFAATIASGSLNPTDFLTNLILKKAEQGQEDAQRALGGLVSRQTGVRRSAGAGGTGTGGSGGADRAAAEARRVLEESEKEAANILKKGRDLAEREYKQNIISLRAYTEKIIDLENKKLASLQLVFDKELALVKKESDVAKIKNDLAKTKDATAKAIQDAQDKQNDAELAAAQAHGQALLSLFDEFSQRQIEATRTNAELNATTYEAAELRILDIQTRVYNERLAFLVAEEERAGENLEKRQAINDQVAKLHADQEALQNEHDRKMDEARKKDLEREKNYLDELLSIDRTAHDKRVALDRLRLQRAFDSGRLSLQNHLFNIQERERIDLAALEAERLRQEREEEERLRATLALEKDYDKRAALMAAHFALIEQIRAEFEQREADRKAQSTAEGQEGGGTFLQGLGDMVGLVKDATGHADALGTAFSNMAGIGLQAISGLAQGVGQLIQNFVLLGNAGPGGMKKVVASVLAGVAAQAGAMAVMHAAIGIAALTPWGFALYGPALMWFKSAAMLGAIALGTGLLGRAVAGNSFQQAGAGGGASGGGGGGGGTTGGRTAEENRVIELERNRPQQVEVRVSLNPSPAFIIGTVETDYRNDGPIRGLIVQAVEA